MVNPRSRRAFTLLELVIYIALMVLVSVPLIVVTLTGSRSYAEGSMTVSIQERNRNVLQRIAEDYRTALSGTTAVSVNGKTLQFTSDGGFDGTSTIPGPVIRYEIRIDTAEASNGKDDNKNGLVDEATIVRINQATGQQVTLAGSLSYEDSSFALSGTGVTIDLTTIGFSYGTQRVSRVQNSSMLHPKN